MKRWAPRMDQSAQEKFILKRLVRVRKLFSFLRLHRGEIFDDQFQAELEGMYRKTGAGVPAIAPAFLCMVLLLQGYVGASDAEAVELAILDLRWQMVLDCLGQCAPMFSQGTLQSFRTRLIDADMDTRLLERTIEVARNTQAFDWEKLPKSLRIAMDSRPLAGAGRVEDTVNLLGTAARRIAECASALSGIPFEVICAKAKAPLLLASSIKAGLDLNWSDPRQKAYGIEIIERQVSSLSDWVSIHLPEYAEYIPLAPHMEALERVKEQDLESAGPGHIKVRSGVAPDRLVSIEDKQMRHGRKSKSKRFNGYKEHVASDLDTQLIMAVTVTPANEPEEQAAPVLKRAVEKQGSTIGSLHIDRGYINSFAVDQVQAQHGEILCKPWGGRNKDPMLFGKRDFAIDMRAKTIKCPAGQVERFEQGEVVEFDPEACGACEIRAQCTKSSSGKGRTVSIAETEALQHRLRKLQSSPAGRSRLRERVGVEHRLAHIQQRKGDKARYIGARKNEYDLRRAAAIQNLETVQRKLAA